MIFNYLLLSPQRVTMGQKAKHIIHLPTQGHPYLVKNKTDELKDLQELVAYPLEKKAYFEIVKNWIIHPMFCESNKYWNLANDIRKCKSTTYVNEMGIPNGYLNNMGCINMNTGIPLFGEVYISITKKQYDKVCNKLGYKLKQYNFNEDMDEDEDDDEQQ